MEVFLLCCECDCFLLANGVE